VPHLDIMLSYKVWSTSLLNVTFTSSRLRVPALFPRAATSVCPVLPVAAVTPSREATTSEHLRHNTKSLAFHDILFR
jgi:hypothetical protein